MGYRSEVSITLSKKAVLQFLNTIPDEFKKMIGYADKFIQKGDNFLLYFSHIKWYQEYGEIGSFTRNMSQLDSDDYHFLRIGENTDDVDDHGMLYDAFDTYIRREINIALEDTKDVELSAFF